MLFPGINGSPLRDVTPGDEGKLRLGGGGGGDLDGFSVRYRGTVSSSGKVKTKSEKVKSEKINKNMIVKLIN